MIPTAIVTLRSFEHFSLLLLSGFGPFCLKLYALFNIVDMGDERVVLLVLESKSILREHKGFSFCDNCFLFLYLKRSGN